MLVALLLLTLSACGGIKQADYDEALAERDALEQELEVANNQLETANSNLETATAELESVKAELVGTNVALSDSQSAVDSLGTDLAGEKSRAEDLQERLDTAHNAAETAKDAITADIYGYLWITPEFYDELESIGFPTEVGDEILDLIHSSWYPWSAFAGSNSLFELDDFMHEVGDNELDATWSRWLDTDIGSDEEALASIELRLRLSLILLQNLENALDATASKG